MCVLGSTKNYRYLIALASSCLALGLLLPMVFHPEAGTSRNFLHFVCGMLIGMSGSINLSLVWRKSRQRRLSIGPRL
jgi:predicted ABC-type exoprotein transport system permease subunit